MVEFLIVAYLTAPAILGLVAVLYALTRTPDRIQLATLALFAASVSYFAGAYELNKSPNTQLAGFVFGTYALVVYVCMAALGLYLKRWAWFAAIGVFALHAVLGVVAAQTMLAQGTRGLAGLVGYFLVAAVGLWALLHKGTLSAVSTAPPSAA
jgi:hypothetical protein